MVRGDRLSSACRVRKGGTHRKRGNERYQVTCARGPHPGLPYVCRDDYHSICNRAVTPRCDSAHTKVPRAAYKSRMSAQYFFHLRVFTLLLAFAALVASSGARADPPAQAARLAYIAGDVSFSRAGNDRWVQARLNRPLTIGDRIWTDNASRAEIQVGGAAVRMGENTSLEILNLTDGLVQVQVDEGLVNVRVRRLGPRQSVEITTPNLAFIVRQPASYRIEVDPAGDSTAIVVRNGRGEVYGDRASYSVNSKQSYRFGGTGLRSYEYIAAPRLSEFDRWGSERDRRVDSSASARYVSRDVIGYEDLDANGTWRNEPGYGRVWAPTRVAKDWTPYRDGHWEWVDPWGWSWVDDAPWGYAVSHYGRWANAGGRWVWVPAPAQSRAVYAPALVGFTGGSNFQPAQPGGNASNVAWFPLGPRDVYRPPYQTSRGYFENINRSNTTVPQATINNAYGNANAPNPYTNMLVVGAIVAVAAAVFIQSRNVAKETVPAPQAAARTPVAAAAPVAAAPAVAASAAPAAKAQPPARTRERRIVAKSAVPETPAKTVVVGQTAGAAAATPATAPATTPAAPAAAAKVIVATPPQAAAPTAPPPAKAPEGTPAEAKGKAGDRKGDDRKGDDRKGGDRKGDDRKGDDRKAPAAVTPAAPAPVATPAPAAPAPVAPAPAAKPAPAAPTQTAPAPEVKPAAPSDKTGERKGGDRRGDDRKNEDRKAPPAAVAPAAPVAPAPAAKPAPVAPAPVAPAPEAKPAAPVDKAGDRKGGERKGDDRKVEERKAPAAAAPVAAPPAAAPPAPAKPAPVAPAPVAKPVPAPAAAPAPAKAEPAPAPKAAPDARKEDAKRADDDKRRAGEDKKRAGEDKRRAEDDKKGPDRSQKRADEDKRRAEEDKKRADEDKKRAEDDKRK
jgi:hypothetical protein